MQKDWGPYWEARRALAYSTFMAQGQLDSLEIQVYHIYAQQLLARVVFKAPKGGKTTSDYLRFSAGLGRFIVWKKVPR